MKVVVDLGKCPDHGRQCVYAAPDLFALDDDGRLALRSRASDVYVADGARLRTTSPAQMALVRDRAAHRQVEGVRRLPRCRAPEPSRAALHDPEGDGRDGGRHALEVITREAWRSWGFAHVRPCQRAGR
jgi:ferredoxin